MVTIRKRFKVQTTMEKNSLFMQQDKATSKLSSQIFDLQTGKKKKALI